MTGDNFDPAVLLRRHRTYHFKTQTGKTLFIVCLAIAVVVLIISYRLRSQGRELSKPVKIAILAAFMAVNAGVVILDGILAD
jgi:F0F1-type ATP synthase membrane subunit a